MKSVFLFSEGLLKVRPYLNFQLIKLVRRVKLLFKRMRQPAIESIVYYRQWRFNNAYLVVEFRLKNAVWLTVGNIKYHDLSQPIVLNLQNIPANTVSFIIYGFSKKLVCVINLAKEAQFRSASFKLSIANDHSIQLFRQQKIPGTPQVRIFLKRPALTRDKIAVTSEGISTNHTPFKSQDYL